MLASHRLVRVGIAVTYVLTAAAGAAVLNYPPKSYAGLSAMVALLWGALLLGPALASAAGVILRRHVLEWAPLYLIAAGLFIYAVLSWWQVPASLGSMPRAFLIAAGMTTAITRATYLATVDLEARRPAMIRAEVDDG